MSFDFYWFSCLLDDEAYERFEPRFIEAMQRARLSAESQRALDTWETDPSQFDAGDALSAEASRLINPVIQAFNLPGFDDLGKSIVSGDLSDYMSEETSFRFIILKRGAPVWVLWRALGFDRARALPGLFGNLLLAAHEVEPALAQVRRAYDGTSIDALVRVSLPMVAASNTESDVREILTMLPEGLERAQELGQGFLAVARPQV
jgi:hypothetical protein